MKFKFLDHTADVLYEAYGSTLNEVFENAAQAMFEVMTDTSKVQPLKKERIKITSNDLISLLYDWLSRLLFLCDVKNMFFSKFDVNVDDKKFLLDAIAYGEEINERHEFRTEVKAVTYHMMDIKRKSGKYVARVLLDI